MKKIRDYEPLNFTSKAQFMRERSPQQLRAFPVEFWEVQYAFLLAINEIEYQLVKGDDAEALRLFKAQANPKASNTPPGAKLKDTSQGDRTGDEAAGERKQEWDNLVQRGRDAYGGASIDPDDPLLQALYEVLAGEDEEALATLRAHFEECRTP